MDQRVDTIRLEMDLTEEIRRCKSCAEAMRIVAKSQDVEQRKTALEVGRHYDQIVAMLEVFKIRIEFPA